MNKIEQVEKDLAEVIKKYELDSMVGMNAKVISKYLTTQMAALKTAYKEAKNDN